MAINSEACANLRIRRDAGICSSVHDWPVAGDSGWHSDAVLAVVPGLTTQAVRRVHCFLRLQRPGSLVLQYTTRLITMDKPGSRSSGDWISNLKVLVTTLQATAMAAPIPCLQSVFAGAMLVLDLIERVAKNETDLVYLADSVVNMTSLLTDELKPGGIGADSRFGELCADYVRYLAQIVHELNKTLAWKSKFWFRKYLKAKSIRDNVDDFTRHLNDLRANLTLAAVVGSHFQGASTDRRVQDVQSTLTRISQNSLIQTPSPNTQSNLNGIGIQGNIEEDILVLKPSELELEFETENRSVLTLTSRGAETPDNRAQVVVRTYGATLGHGKATTVRIYEGDRANQIWEKDLQMFAAHLRIPGVAQLYGMCTSLRLQALVFHDELVPIDIYAANISSPARSVDFELSLIRNFASAFSHISAVVGVEYADYREILAELALIKRSNGKLVVSHLPYSNDTDISITEKQMGGPLHSWFSSVGCLASLPYETPEAVVQAIDKRPGHTTGTHYVSISCSILGILSRYRAFSLGDGQQRFKLGSIYLQRPGDLKVAHAIAEIPGIESEILIEDWSTRNGRFEELDGWTRFQVDLKKDCLEPGYFLSAYGSVYMPVPERERQRAGWLLQAQSILNRTGLLERGWDHQDMLIAELFFVYLDWQLFIVDDGTPGSEDLPSSIYLFVENIPVDSGGVISKPSTFWSVDPRGTVTDLDIGSRLWSEGWFSVRGSGRSWENYHYAAAQVLQETSGFDPTTTSAANSHGFSTYEVSTLPIPEKGDGPKGLSETVTSSNDMQSVAVIGRLQ